MLFRSATELLLAGSENDTSSLVVEAGMAEESGNEETDTELVVVLRFSIYIVVG